MRRLAWALIGLAAVVCAGVAALAWRGWHTPADALPVASAVAPAATQEAIERGRRLALLGNCAACHTVRGGVPYAGGRAIETPFGRVYASNLTPDRATGLGAWSAGDFWRALHHGRSRDGRLLTPAFPYPQFTRVTRDDADALFAYLQSLAPVAQANRPHELRFPYDQPLLLAVWRGLYFRPGVFEPDATRDARWNRGAYLVQGLGHCGACHTRRDSLGGSVARDELAGGMIPMQGWYASPLNAMRGGGLGDWPEAEVVQLLKTGISPRGSVAGPMAEVVAKSLQHVDAADLGAMVAYLKSLPAPDGATVAGERSAGAAGPMAPPAEEQMIAGAALYRRHCEDCHGADGRGMPPHYPPLAGNRSLTQASPANPVRIVLDGGFPPGTAGNPRPYGMPPYRLQLSDAEIAALLTWVRNAWGNRAPAVGAIEVDRYRGAATE